MRPREEVLVPDPRAGMRPRDHVDQRLRRLLGYVPTGKRAFREE